MKIKRFFECLLPVTACNLRCPYCYVIQENRRKNQIPQLAYSTERILESLTMQRLGGPCFFSLCGAGETLLQPECIPIVAGLLKNGHAVNITTNGTVSGKFDELIEAVGSDIKYLHVSFSLHYTELKKRNLVDSFFQNINKMRNAGASILVQFNLCDEYMPHLETIKKLCIQNVGALPQVALTRDESENRVKIHSKLSPEEYYEVGKQFESPLFDFTVKNFNVKRSEFCYAGDWSGTLNLQTGILTKCYANHDGAQDIFADPEAEIDFEAIGCGCRHWYCVNSSHFMSLGVIPSISTPSYADLRNRPKAEWYTPEMMEVLNSRLCESNTEYSIVHKLKLGWRQGHNLQSKLKGAIKYSLPTQILQKITK